LDFFYCPNSAVHKEKMMIKRIAATTAALAMVATGSIAANAAETPVYLEKVAAGTELTVLATAGDKIGEYYLPGIPDGLGAYKSGSNLKVLMNHELSAAGIAGTITRANGKTTGTTITEFTIDPTTNKVLSAKEAINKVSFYNYATKKYSATAVAPATGAVLSDTNGKYHTNALSRFCSSSFAPAGTFATKVKGKTVGYTGGIYLTGEEIGDEGRGFALNTAGELVQIPRFGLSSWETFSAVNTGSVKTSILGTEDGPDGSSELWLYEGTKSSKGTWFEKAGLTNGKSYVLKVDGATTDSEFRTAYGKGKPAAATFVASDWTVGGAMQNSWAADLGFGFSAVEDGAFDPNNPNDYYFVQKSSAGKATSLNPDDKTVVKRDGGSMWKLSFTDIKNPSKGATLELVLDGNEAPYLNMPDNIDIDDLGNILIQEDPGKNAQLSRVIAYNIKTKKMAVIARFKDVYFSSTAPAASKITEDEESSGIIDVTRFFKKSATDTARYYLLDAQVHATPELSRPDITDAAHKAKLAELVEGGQLYLMTVADWSKVDFK
jgi:secreted PhoX family phosphatase